MTEALLVLALSALAFANVKANVEYDGRLNVRLRHSFGTDGEFVERGNVTVQSVRSGAHTFERAPLGAARLALVEDPANADLLYRLESTVSAPDGSEADFLSSVKMGALLGNGLRDAIDIWVLGNGAVAAVGISPSPSPSLADPALRLGTPSDFSSEVRILHAQQAPAPDTAGYVQKLEREREAREKGDFKDNRSFIAKYWMYIVPAVIFVLLSGAANPDQQTAAR